ncbi:retrovirus-related pol polyprotein from transposon TNT 1-94 [Tanacetum coccineum]
MFDELLNPPPSVVSPVPAIAAQRLADPVSSPVSTSIDQDAPSSSNPSTQEQEQSLIISQGVEESPKTPHFHDDLLHETLHEDSTSQGSSSNVRPSHTPLDILGKWTKNHPLVNMIRDPSLVHVCPDSLYEVEVLIGILHFQYLKGTIDMGLWYSKDSCITLTAYADVDHAGCQDSRRSTSGSAQFLGEKLVSTMNTTAQQTALNNALVAPGDRVKIGKCNMRIIPIMTNKEPTYQVVLDALALSPLYLAFLITAEFKLDKKKCRVDVEVFRDILQIYPRLPNQEFVEPPSSNEEIVSFIKELGYKGDIESITEVYLDHMHQPWRTFLAIINRLLSRKTTRFMFQIDNRNTSATRKENMPYPRFTKAIIQHFNSKDKSISMRNRRFMHTIQDDTLLGAATPKKARKFKKPTSPSKKKTLVAVEEPANKSDKKPTARRQFAGVQIKDTPGVSVSKKKAPAKAKRSKGIELLSKAAILEEAQMKKAIKRSK